MKILIFKRRNTSSSLQFYCKSEYNVYLNSLKFELSGDLEFTKQNNFPSFDLLLAMPGRAKTLIWNLL